MTHRDLNILIKEPATSGVMLTNTSGGILSIAVYDVDILTSIVNTVAATAASDISLQVDGITVVQFNAVFTGAGMTSSWPFHHNCNGQQFSLANGHTITINQQINASVFTRTACSMAIEAVSGS